MRHSDSCIRWVLSTDSQASQPMVCITFSLMPLYSIAFSAEFSEEIRTAIPSIVKHLERADSDIRQATLAGLSSLATHGMHHLVANVTVLNCVFSRVS